LGLMERLDPEYAKFKQLSQDSSKTAEERAAAGENLVQREMHLQPAYKQLALLYADLHEYVLMRLPDGQTSEHCYSRAGRMDAKGCAKPMVWKNSRRHFYWALRARLARANALAQIQSASPESTLDYRSRLLDSLLVDVESPDNHDITVAIEGLSLEPTLDQLYKDSITKGMLALAQKDRKAALDGILRVADSLSDDEKATLIANLQATRTGRLYK
jgi:acetyl-CoA carboxylase / biotin carboxylase 1